MSYFTDLWDEAYDAGHSPALMQLFESIMSNDRLRGIVHRRHAEAVIAIARREGLPTWAIEAGRNTGMDKFQSAEEFWAYVDTLTPRQALLVGEEQATIGRSPLFQR